MRLAAGLTDSQVRAQVHPAFSPIGWHLGHIAWQEEVWLHRRVLGRAPLDPHFDALFDSFRSEKQGRGARLPPLEGILGYLARVRDTTLASLERDLDSPLLEGGWVLRFLANHERQHAEIVAIVRLLGGFFLEDAPHQQAQRMGSEREERGDWLPVQEGVFFQGSEDPEGWDNEKLPHPIFLPAFQLGRRPVSNGEWMAFLEEGGLETEGLWSKAGWRFRRANGLAAPLHWRRGRDGAWRRLTLYGEKLVDPSHPVAHVSWFEAEAFAAFRGARLPTESEWERVAGWDSTSNSPRRWPSGDQVDPAANLALRHLDTAPIGLASTNDGVDDLLGNVWEWTSSHFLPYPGFRPGPYRGYSLPWFGDAHRSLRGGSYLTHPFNARSSFRNWLVPEMRCYPTGLRLAR